MKNKLFLIAIFSLGLFNTGVSQYWPYASLHNGINGNIFGTINNYPINIYTNNRQIAQFTTNNSLTSIVANAGDGLRILNQNPFGGGTGHLDLFTSTNSGQNETHIKFGSNGQISGQANRLEFRGFTNQGLWFNTEQSNAKYIFAKGGLEQARIGTNNYFRIGINTLNLNAFRRLEVFDEGKNPQFRITAQANSSTFVDFTANNNGTLSVLPSGGRVGIKYT